jgi:CspA family cold shock protein
MIDEVRVMKGPIKWYDPSKGYGFFVDEQVGEDVLIHRQVLTTFGYQSAPTGATVECRALLRPKGWQAFDILAVDLTTAYPSSNHNLDRASDWEEATVKWFNKARGYGFLLKGDGTRDIFCHMETVRSSGMIALVPNQPVMVKWAQGKNGIVAVELKQR